MAGRVALVTGGAGAIGAAICRRLARDGLRVAVADLGADTTRAVADEIDGLAVEMDVTDPASVDLARDQVRRCLGPVEVCVGCAGWDELRPFVETDESFQRRVLEINLAGAIRVTRAVLPDMLDAGWGRIVHVSSDAGRVGSSGEAIYSAAKGGVIAFTKSIARESARRGVTANTVCPGPTDTPLLARMAEGGGDGWARALARAVPMGRVGTPDDVAPAVAFLVSEEAGYITGQTLSVSGGLTMA